MKEKLLFGYELSDLWDIIQGVGIRNFKQVIFGDFYNFSKIQVKSTLSYQKSNSHLFTRDWKKKVIKRSTIMWYL